MFHRDKVSAYRSVPFCLWMKISSPSSETAPRRPGLSRWQVSEVLELLLVWGGVWADAGNDQKTTAMAFEGILPIISSWYNELLLLLLWDAAAGRGMGFALMNINRWKCNQKSNYWSERECFEGVGRIQWFAIWMEGKLWCTTRFAVFFQGLFIYQCRKLFVIHFQISVKDSMTTIN